MQTVEEKRAYNKERYQRRRGKQIEQAKRYALRNKERIKNNYLLRNYGITLIHYNIMRESQNFRCAICGKHEKDLGYELRVDHQHIENYNKRSAGEKIRYIRGLLCDICNLGVSYFADSPDRMELARNYLIERNK